MLHIWKDYDLKEFNIYFIKVVEKGFRNTDILHILNTLVDDDDIPLLIRTMMAQINYSLTVIISLRQFRLWLKDVLGGWCHY